MIARELVELFVLARSCADSIQFRIPRRLRVFVLIFVSVIHPQFRRASVLLTLQLPQLLREAQIAERSACFHSSVCGNRHDLELDVQVEFLCSNQRNTPVPTNLKKTSQSHSSSGQNGELPITTLTLDQHRLLRRIVN